MEIVVTPDNRWHTVGDNGAEFANIPRGSIVFNHRQTEELLANGKVTSGGGRGKAYALGTYGTYATTLTDGSSSGGSSGYGGAMKKVSKKAKELSKSLKKLSEDADSGSSGDGGGTDKDESNTADSKKEFEETIDFVEMAISRIEREIDNLDRTASSVYKSWGERNTALSDQISMVGDEIALQQSAAQEYLKEANQVGLDESYAKQIREGSLNIEDFKGEGNEELVEKIKNYQQWYEKYIGCIDAAKELREEEAKLYAQRFENVQEQYESILQGYEHTESMLNEYINQAEARGHIVSEKYYNALIDNEKQNISELKKEQSALIAERDKAVADGKIAKYSQEWYDMCSDIDSVTQAIEEGATSIIKYQNAIRDIDFEKFERIQEYISDVADEAEFLIELMSSKDLYDDKGVLTEQGAATLGLHGAKHNTYMYQADDYGNKVAEIDSKIASGELDGASKDVIDKRREYVEAQRESILAAEQEKQAIKDLVADGIEKELDSLQELIDKKNEALESEKDLYEYQKKVKEQTEEIASLEKQMAAYENDSSEEAKAKIQELKVSLEDAKTELKETEWDRYIDQQAQLLDTLYTEYENVLNTRLDNIDYLLQQVVDGVNASSLALGADGTITTALGIDGAIAQAITNAVGEQGSIQKILNGEANNVGTRLSNAMNSIWSVGEGNAKSILTTYGDGFQGKQTTANETLNGIKLGVDKMVAKSDAEAQKKVEAPKTKPSSVANPAGGAGSGNGGSGNGGSGSGGDGKAKVGDKVKFESGQYYYDSQGKKPVGSKYKGKQVYITKIETAKWATHPYHISTGNKLGKGDLGWLKKEQLSGYATGKQNFIDNEIAWTQENGKEFIVRPSDGAILTPIAKGDSVLTAAASKNIWDMANSPAEFIKNNLNLGAGSVPNNSTVQSNYVQNLDKVVFNFPNVKNYEEFLSAMQKDRNFERLVQSMTIDQIAGKSSLAKGKSIR